MSYNEPYYDRDNYTDDEWHHYKVCQREYEKQQERDREEERRRTERIIRERQYWLMGD